MPTFTKCNNDAEKVHNENHIDFKDYYVLLPEITLLFDRRENFIDY